jgi:hypothetical protein
MHDLNGPLMVLLPKSSGDASIKDYMPIALIHLIGKLITKVLANRLAPQLNGLIHCCQSTFIKGHCIQDNFRFLQASTRLLHARKLPCLLLKIDIMQAFDSVTWSFLLEILHHMGFLSGWRDWISTLLSSASTKVMLNGVPCEMICHARGLRQGDPLSPMLFLLVMEVLSALIRAIDSRSLLQHLQVRPIPHRVSLYADDLIVFLKPVPHDLQLLQGIFNLFQGSSRLGYNLSKCQMAPIRCDDGHVQLPMEFFPCQVVQFPLST